VFDPHAASSKLALAELKKPRVEEQLVRFGKWFVHAGGDAEDLVQNALIRVLDPDDAPWVPPRPTFIGHMMYLMRWNWNTQMRRASAQREVLDAGLAANERTASPNAPADEELNRLRTLGRLQSWIETALAATGAKHPLVRPVYELGARGIDEPSEQARLLRCSVDAVLLATKTLKYHVKLARDEWDRAEERRMRDLRAAATKRKSEATP
jgi:hypothetical protein